jgi:hypothetical protein
MTHLFESSPSNLTEAALLGGSDESLADFDRAYHVFQSIVTSCRALYEIGPAVTIFGSARLGEVHPHILAWILAHPGQRPPSNAGRSPRCLASRSQVIPGPSADGAMARAL